MMDNTEKSITNAVSEKTKPVYNRIKVVLAEKRLTNNWLAVQMQKDPGTVSKWATNSSQPSVGLLFKIAAILDVDVKDLLWSTKEK